jgi:hypothetical protein
MPRAKKTQTPQSPGLEAGAAYGEVTENIQAQEAIPLPQKAPPGGMVAPQQAAPPAFGGPAAPGPLPLEAAAAYTPQITPLTAPGRGMTGGAPMLPPNPNQDAAQMLRNWAEAVNEPAFVDAAMQLGQ